MARYNVNNYTVETLLSDIKCGSIAIPEMQRPFVWDSSKVRDLVDSLYKGFPVGYIIVWQNPDVKLKDGTTSSGKKVLIDGQQRITAMAAAVVGQEVLDEHYKWRRIAIAFNPLEEKFEVANNAILKSSKSFEIQTIGRIRRMPEARHYEDDVLDFCYVYTFDEKYKAGLLSNVDKAYETRRLFLKDKCKTFTLEKEMRDLDFDGLGEREVLYKIHEYLVEKYRLGSDRVQNQRLLADAGYIFGAEIRGQALQGEFVWTSALADSHNYIETHKRVDTHKHGMQLMHSVDAIKSSIGMAQDKVKIILERLFRKGGNQRCKIVSLETAEFYAFVINNQHKLKEEFRAVTAQMEEQISYGLNPKRSTFHIPEQDFYRYDPNVKSEVEYLSNAYEDYTSGFATSVVRSTCEMLFEQYCESRDDIEWVYKNGDTGQQYFSIVYVDGIRKQWLFYADYIVMKKDGTVWVIETKGGESKGQDKNIDHQIENKFNAFKAYAEKHNLHWGFVRDKDNRLYINNTVFAEDMAEECWVPLMQEF